MSRGVSMFLGEKEILTLIRDCILIIKADGVVEDEEIERLDSVLQPTLNGIESRPIIDYLFNNMREVEQAYPVDSYGIKFFLDAAYKVLISASKISSKAITEFSKIADRLGVADTGFFEEFLENIDARMYKQHDDNSLSLIQEVDKLSINGLGVFAQAYEDLGGFSDKYVNLDLSVATHDEKLLMMAYAYARRSVGCALVAQGVWGLEELMPSIKMFYNFQTKTGQTKEFQESANDQAEEFIISYDERLTRSAMSRIATPIIIAMQQSAPTASDYGITYTIDEMLEV